MARRECLRIIPRVPVSLASRQSAVLFAVVLTGIVTAATCGQTRTGITGDRLSGFVLPVEPVDGGIHFEALRGDVWEVDDTQRLLLDEDVRIQLGEYEFRSDAAVVWLNRIPSAEGLINQVAIYFGTVGDPKRQAGLGVWGSDVLVTGSAAGEVSLQVALLSRGEPRGSALARAGQNRLAEYLQRLLASPPNLAQQPQAEQPLPPDAFVPTPGRLLDVSDYELPKDHELPPLIDPHPPLFGSQGTVRVAAQQFEVTSGEDENIITATGGLVVHYASHDTSREWSQLTLAAHRAVIFTDPGALDAAGTWELGVEAVRGIYLEGNVTVSAEGGDYAVRAPRVYYDFRTNQALMVDAVLRSAGLLDRSPVHARAAEMRQLAANQWEARRAQVSVSEFATPHLSVGADRVLIEQRPSPEQTRARATHIESEGNTLRLGGAPILAWPKFSGTIDDLPLRHFRLGTQANDGLRVETGWDPFALLGVQRPESIGDAELRFDLFTARGAAVGLSGDFDGSFGRGVVDLYGLFDDGTDRTSSGLEVTHSNDFRGVALFDHQLDLGRHWTMQSQLSIISDASFITTWRESDFAERREYETSVYFRRQEDNAALTALFKYDVNDFISNSWLLASQAYSVNKFPEVGYRRYGDRILGDRFTYSSETTASRVQMVFDPSTPMGRGVPGAAFGIGPGDSIADSLMATGLHASTVSRFDTRHEVSMPTQVGPVKVVPFAVARFTAYDDDFDAFSPGTDSSRFFGAVGVRLTTQLQRVHNEVESRLFDLHRLRHVIEPSLILWYGDASVDQASLPVYDVAVESLADGAMAQLGVRNVWQTYRGGPGRRRSVDVFTLDTRFVVGSGDTIMESPTAQFFAYRPEYSQIGDHAHVEAVWLASDTLAILGEGTYDLDSNLVARSSIGARLEHSPLTSSSIEYRRLAAADLELIEFGWQYRMSARYLILVRPQWDLEASDFRSFLVRVVRSFPEFDFIVQVSHDDIRDDTSIGAALQLAEF